MTLGHTQIEYLDRLWHPTTGCSLGCPYCWARPLVTNRLAGTMKGIDPGIFGEPFTPTFHADRLADPLRARKGQVIGVSYFGDLFDRGITDELIAAVFGVMAACPQHQFLVLTKQAERMEKWGRWLEAQRGRWPGCPWDWQTSCLAQHLWSAIHYTGQINLQEHWPLPNVWGGVSVTNQDDADRRVGPLLRSPFAHRWISYEPALGPIEVKRLLDIDLVIMGGLSGKQASEEERSAFWSSARSMRDQCQAAGVMFHLKQGAGLHPEKLPELDGTRWSALPWRE